MDEKSALMLGLLVNRYHQKSPEKFLKSIPSAFTKEVSLGDLPHDQPALCLEHPRHKIEVLHYSWLIPYFKKTYPSLMNALLTVLTEKQRKGVVKILKISYQEQTIAQPVQNFLMHDLIKKLEVGPILPRSCLPQTSLTLLSSFTKDQILELVDYLGVYDLTEEVKRILDKKYLKNIYNCLHPLKLKFLRQCLHQKTRIISSRLGLQHWEGKCEELQAILHRRGLLRLAKALSGQHPDLIWYVTHILDTGRSQIIYNQVQIKENPSVTAGLIQQVQTVLNFIHKEAS